MHHFYMCELYLWEKFPEVELLGQKLCAFVMLTRVASVPSTARLACPPVRSAGQQHLFPLSLTIPVCHQNVWIFVVLIFMYCNSSSY